MLLLLGSLLIIVIQILFFRWFFYSCPIGKLMMRDALSRLDEELKALSKESVLWGKDKVIGCIEQTLIRHMITQEELCEIVEMSGMLSDLGVSAGKVLKETEYFKEKQ